MTERQIQTFRAAAGKIATTTANYVEKRRQRLKWCPFHKDWEPESKFSADKSHADGLAGVCREGVRARRISKQFPVPAACGGADTPGRGLRTQGKRGGVGRLSVR